MAFSAITEGTAGPLAIVDLVGSALLIADVAVAMRTGFWLRWDVQRALVMDSRLAAKFYVQHGTFVCDVLAAGPPFVLIVSSRSRRVRRGGACRGGVCWAAE